MILGTFQRLRDRGVDKLYSWLKMAEERSHQTEADRLKRSFDKCGQDVHLIGPTQIHGSEAIQLGDNVHIGANAFIRGEGGLTIGSHTMISRNLVLYTMNHNWQGERLPYDNTFIKKPVKIGMNVWIGMNVCICPGTIIEDGAIIGMGSVISGHVPAHAIVGNTKWRTLAYRNEADYTHLLAGEQFADPYGRPLVLSEH